MYVHQKLFNDCDAHSEHDSYSFIAAADMYAHVSHHMTFDRVMDIRTDRRVKRLSGRLSLHWVLALLSERSWLTSRLALPQAALLQLLLLRVD